MKISIELPETIEETHVTILSSFATSLTAKAKHFFGVDLVLPPPPDLGCERPDDYVISLDAFANAIDATAFAVEVGMSMVYWELDLYSTMTVEES